jgi:hypothetical protein
VTEEVHLIRWLPFFASMPHLPGLRSGTLTRLGKSTQKGRLAEAALLIFVRSRTLFSRVRAQWNARYLP